MEGKHVAIILGLLSLCFNSYGQKTMTFKEAEVRGTPFQRLDSLFKSAVHSGPDLTVFKSPDQQGALQKSYITLIKYIDL